MACTAAPLPALLPLCMRRSPVVSVGLLKPPWPEVVSIMLRMRRSSACRCGTEAQHAVRSIQSLSATLSTLAACPAHLALAVLAREVPRVVLQPPHGGVLIPVAQHYLRRERGGGMGDERQKEQRFSHSGAVPHTPVPGNSSPQACLCAPWRPATAPSLSPRGTRRLRSGRWAQCGGERWAANRANLSGTATWPSHTADTPAGPSLTGRGAHDCSRHGVDARHEEGEGLRV